MECRLPLSSVVPPLISRAMSVAFAKYGGACMCVRAEAIEHVKPATTTLQKESIAAGFTNSGPLPQQRAYKSLASIVFERTAKCQMHAMEKVCMP